MKKTLLLFLVSFLVVILFSGCGQNQDSTIVDDSEPVTPTPSLPPMKGITVNKIVFEVLDFNSLSNEHKKIIEENKTSRGYSYWEEDNGYVIVIFAGEKSTAGHKTDVIRVEDNEGKTVILVEEKAPKEMGATVISYPYTIIKAKGITNNFIIEDFNGKLFNALSNDSAGTDTKIIEENHGIYLGSIDSNSIEIKLSNGEIRAFMVYEVADSFQQIKENTSINISYYENKYQQLILTEFTISE